MPNGADHPGSSLDMLAELAERQKALEDKMDTVLEALDRFRSQGGDFDVAHASHILQKHFFHDRPEPVADKAA